MTTDDTPRRARLDTSEALSRSGALAAEKILKARRAADDDAVDHPRHYSNGPVHLACGEPIECIDVVEGLPGNLFNTVKYIWRRNDKGTKLQDLRKARWYLDREIARVEAGRPLWSAE